MFDIVIVMTTKIVTVIEMDTGVVRVTVKTTHTITFLIIIIVVLLVATVFRFIRTAAMQLYLRQLPIVMVTVR